MKKIMNTKNIFLLLFLNLGTSLLFAQGENDNWYFGYKAAVNFSNSTPAAITNSVMETLEACGSVSDSNGDLLFYMSPQNIWNRDNQVMTNGNLVSYMDTAQQLAIVQNPANDNQYYVFTTGVNGIVTSTYRINYSIVDMSLGNIGTNGNTLGEVLYRFKQIPVLDDAGNLFTSEAITIVPNTDGVSYWVLIPNDKRLYAYRLDANGFDNGNPVISNLNLPISGNHYAIKASPKVYYSHYTHYICISPWADTYAGWNLPDDYFTNQVYSFNAATGEIVPDFYLEANALRTYSAEFNRDASVLFLGAHDLYAVDLNNSFGTSVHSMMVYDDPQSYSSGSGMAIQRNAKGDIYFSKNFQLYLAQILKPDVFGPGIGYDLNAIYLGGTGSTGSGLPQLIPSLDLEGHRTMLKQSNPDQKRMVLMLDQEERKQRLQMKNIEIYPNPVSDLLTIKTDLKIENVSVSDISGKNSNVTLRENKVDVRNLPAGSYIITIETKEGKTTKKFIKK
jgi:hypothetical protein